MKSSVNSYAVLRDGANLSDHLPAEFKLCFLLSRIPSKADRRTVLEYRWDKGDINSYYYHTGVLLQKKIVHEWPCLYS